MSRVPGKPVTVSVKVNPPPEPAAPITDAKTPEQVAARKQYEADARAEAKMRKKAKRGGGRGGAPSDWS